MIRSQPHVGEVPRGAPGLRVGGRAAIRADIHARFLRILERVDQTIAAERAIFHAFLAKKEDDIC